MAKGPDPKSASGPQYGGEHEWYDLLPIEKKLVSWSLGLGIVFLIIFFLIFVVFK
jgi:hypothetical protein